MTAPGAIDGLSPLPVTDSLSSLPVTDGLSRLPLADLPERTPALAGAASVAVAGAPAAAPPRPRNLHGIAEPRSDYVRAAAVDSQHAVHKARENRREWVARGQGTEVRCGT